MIRIGIGKNLRIQGNGGSPWTPELDQYISGLVTPLSNAQLLLLDIFILALKSGLSITSLAEAFDTFYILAGETEESSLRNIVQDLAHCTNDGTADFTQYEGLAGDAIGKYANTNFIPSTQAVTYQPGDLSYGAYTRQEKGAPSTGNTLGNFDGADNDSYLSIQRRVTIGTDKLRCLGQGLTYDSRQNYVASIGMICGCQDNLTLSEYRNKILIDTDAGVVPLSLPATSPLLLASRTAFAVPSAFDDEDISGAWFGKNFDITEVGIITDAFEAYMDAHGKGVIP